MINLYNVPWKKKYSQKEIIESTGLSPKTVSQLFSGRHYNYELFTLEAITKFFNCKLHDILLEVDDDQG
ncbi:helix-turn-helix domain-containing protein [bacterium]|nr:helix-turn-helix domain-containing protein [bacterium]